jgi:ATP-dependent DNA helicase RecG
MKMPESQNIEWKSKWKDEYLEWICGYANAQGGKIYIGCDDDGKVVGLPNARKLLEDVPNKIRDAMGIIVGVNLLEEDGLEYIEIDVPSYPIGISCKGVYYYRSGSTRQVLTGPALEAFLMRKRGATWDNLPLPAFSIADVDDRVVSKFKSLAVKKGRMETSLLEEPKEILLDKLHLKNGDYLTNAAMLLFSNDPERYQTGAYIKIGYFENDAELLYQDEIHGSILEQVDKALDIIYLKYMRAKIRYEGAQRIERYFVPEAALREALLNAICHKQYQSGIPIQISVYEDRLYVANVGSLPEDWTLENLMQKHASKPYNPNIAHVFYLAGFIESWGRGVEKICQALKADNLPLPEYTIHPGDIMIKFTAPEDRIVRLNKQFTDNLSDNLSDKLTDKEQKTLELLLEDPGYTASQLAQKLLVSRVSATKYLKALKEKGIIERIGSDRSGHWKIN